MTEIALPTQGQSKAKNIVLWIVQLGTAGMFLMASYAKLSGAPMMVQMFNAIGIGQWFRYLTGGIEVVGAVLLLIPALSGVGGLLLLPTMIGAVLTHLFILGGSPTAAVILLLSSAIIAWGRKERTLALIGRE